MSLSGSADTPRNGPRSHLFTLNLRVAASHGQRQVLNSNVASILKQLKGLLPLLVLAAVSLRVITGAAEVQVNFTSIIVEQYKTLENDVDKESMLRGVVASNPADASSIPDNLKTFATYKKYLMPENGIQLSDNPSQIPFEAVDVDRIPLNSHSQKVVYRPASHSPPLVVSTYLYTHTTNAVEAVKLENNFGKNKNTYSGEFYSF
jgi:hypothetical protein